jgi:hypothetical protein
MRDERKWIDMTALVAGLVGAAFVMLFVLFYVGVRRMERDVDYGGLRGAQPDEKLGLLARVVANVIVASP